MMRICRRSIGKGRNYQTFENDNLQKTVEEIAAFVLSYNG